MAAQPGQRRHAQRAFLIDQVCGVVAPHAVLVAHGAAVRGNLRGHGAFELLPALEIGRKAARSGGPDVLRIDAAALRVHVRQMRESVHGFAEAGKHVARGLLHGVHQRLDLGPVHRGFDGVHAVAQVPQRVAQVGAFEAVGRPLAAHGGADVDRAMAAQIAPGLAQRVARGGRVGGHAQHQKALAGAAAAPGKVALQQADEALVPGQREVGFGLDGVGQPQHRQRQPALHQRAHSGLGAVPVGQKEGMKAFVPRQGRDAHRGLGQDAKAPLRAQHQLAQIWPGAGGGQGGQHQRAHGGFHAPARKELLDAPVTQRLLAARPRHHPAAHGGIFERLRKMPQRVALGAQLGFDLRPWRARAEGGELAGLVQVQQPVHAREVDAEDGPLAQRAVQVPRHAGAARERDHHPAVRLRQVEQRAHLFARFGEGHAIGHRGQRAEALLDPVGVALAQRHGQARRGIALDQRVLGQARGRNACQQVFAPGVLPGPARAQALRQHGAGAVAQVHRGGIVAPAVPSPHECILPKGIRATVGASRLFAIPQCRQLIV